jgi:hypothetical protein
MGTNTYWPAAPASGMTDIEQRAGVQPISDIEAETLRLEEELAETDQEYSDLWALYGPGGTHDADRRRERGTLAVEIRDAFATQGKKITETEVEDRACQHPAYKRLCDDAVIGRAKFKMLETRRARIERRLDFLREHLRRGNKALDFVSREPRA